MFKSNFKTGLYFNLEEGVYRSDGALSTSDLKYLAKTNPEHFKAQTEGKLPFRKSPAMELGSQFHMYILERERWDKETIVRPDEYKDGRLKATKEWNKEHAHLEIVSAHNMAAIEAMSERWESMEEVQALVDPKYEVSAVAKGHRKGIDAKCRIDVLAGDTVVDIKTTRAGGANPWTFKRTVRDLRYHWQEQNYRNIAKAAGREIKHWYWAVIETEAPYDYAVYDLVPQDLVMAEAELEKAYNTMIACGELNSWPNYTPTESRSISIYGNL